MEEAISAAKAFGVTAKEMKEGMQKLLKALPTCRQISENFTIKAENK